MQKIDFVVTWVDDTDVNWQKKYNEYSSMDTIDVKNARFRDFEIFNYWFRAVEKYAPWVHKVFLVTDNQVPEWLLADHPKLKIIFHQDFIPKEYLPIFNSSAIEINLSNIASLSEHFVYFNDDMFLNAPVKPTDFFSKDGLPKDTAGLNAIQPAVDFDYIHVNNMNIINNRFDKKEVMRRQLWKFFNIQNMELNIYTALLFFWPKFTRFFDLHYPYSILKSKMKEVMSENPQAYSRTMADRFRGKNDITIWVVRYYQLVQGLFSVRSPRVGKIYDLHTKSQQAIDDIESGKHKMIVINDHADIDSAEFQNLKIMLKKTFEKKFSEKSTFER